MNIRRQCSTCGRESYRGGNLCIFHVEKENFDHVAAQEFADALISTTNGDWRGFQFPQYFDMPKRLRGPVIASGSRLGSLRIFECEFTEEVDFSNCVFEGSVKVEASTFKKDFSAQGTTFHGTFEWDARCIAAFNLGNSAFLSTVEVRGELELSADFARCTFSDNTSFSGAPYGAPRSNKPPVFYELLTLFGRHATFDGADFKRPERVRFRHVNLSYGHFGDANVDKVAFIGVTWPRIGRRRAVYDEIAHATYGPNIQAISGVEATYRNLRVAHENAKDFDTASDFYIGEMKARLRQMTPWRSRVFSLPATYGHLSGFGTRPGRASVVLAGMLAAYGSAWAGCHYGFGREWPDAHMIHQTLLHVIWLLPWLHSDSSPTDGADLGLATSLVRLMVIIQSALLVLSLRARIKRG